MTYALQVTSDAPRAGRMFEPIQERALHAAALWAAESLPGASRGLVVVPEFAGPIGVPDFTAFVGSPSDVIDRQRSLVPPIVNEIDAGIVATVHARRALDAHEIATNLGWPLHTVAGRMRRLVLTGALIESRPGSFVRPPEVVSNGRLYAIEAKVEDWRSALRQVRTYRVWADAYVLVMSGLSQRSKDLLLAEVRQDRGGLVLDGTWLARPRLRPAPEHRRLQAAEMFADATRSGLERPTFAEGVRA